MKLPNFLEFSPLRTLKRQMSIPDDVYGDFNSVTEVGRLTLDELSKLNSGDGLDVAFDELTILADGTLAYKDARVLLYIRDVAVYGAGRGSDPRYHLSNCDTLQRMTLSGRFERYVIATEVTGNFRLNFITNGKTKSEKRKLSVCQNCLTHLKFDGFRPEWDGIRRTAVVSNFTPELFFSRYPKSLHGSVPRHTDATSPLNVYSSDWIHRSRTVRSRSNWTCSKCRQDFSSPERRHYLDAHHKNGQKWDNSEANLIALCIGCHAELPNHGHMKSDPRYASYVRTSKGRA